MNPPKGLCNLLISHSVPLHISGMAKVMLRMDVVGFCVSFIGRTRLVLGSWSLSLFMRSSTMLSCGDLGKIGKVMGLGFKVLESV